MRAVAVLRALGPIDAANVRRDPLLRWMLVMPLVFGLMFRGVGALVEPWLADRFSVALTTYYPLIAGSIVLLPPMLYGVVVGFLLLDHKDDRTLTALQVTPLTPSGYLAYRIAIPVVLSIAITPLVFLASGFSELGIGGQLLAAVAAAPFGPAFTFFIAAFAKNKVQGFALMKAAGVINWPPIIAWFVTSDWQLAFGLCPTYWPVKFYWELEAGRSGSWIYLLTSVIYLGLLIVAFHRRFERIMTR